MNNTTNINVPKKYQGMVKSLKKVGNTYYVECAEGFEFNASYALGVTKVRETSQKAVLEAIRTIAAVEVPMTETDSNALYPSAFKGMTQEEREAVQKEANLGLVRLLSTIRGEVTVTTSSGYHWTGIIFNETKDKFYMQCTSDGSQISILKSGIIAAALGAVPYQPPMTEIEMMEKEQIRLATEMEALQEAGIDENNIEDLRELSVEHAEVNTEIVKTKAAEHRLPYKPMVGKFRVTMKDKTIHRGIIFDANETSYHMKTNSGQRLSINKSEVYLLKRLK